MRKASLFIPLRQTSLSNRSWCIQEFFLEVRFSFLLRRNIQLPITARDRQLLLARFKKKQVNRIINRLFTVLFTYLIYYKELSINLCLKRVILMCGYF